MHGKEKEERYMGKYETPTMELIDSDITIDTIIESIIDKDDNNQPMKDPWA